MAHSSGRVGHSSVSDLPRPWPAARRYPRPVIFYSVVSSQTEQAVDMFVRREDAETMIGEVREDEPELAETLRIEEIPLRS